MRAPLVERGVEMERLESLKAEVRAVQKWEHKYLTAEQRAKEAAAQEEAFASLGSSAGMMPKHQKGVSERDAMELRLRAFDDEENDPAAQPPPRVLPHSEVLRMRVAADVAATRQRSHRFTGDMSTESMLKDIGPGLWTSINPSYAPLKLASSTHKAHTYDRNKGWGDKVDKTHHLKMDDFMQHAEKSLQLGEKVFVSGGMKLSKG